MEWLLLVFPCVTMLALFRMYEHKMVIWEYPLPLIVSALAVLSFKSCSDYLQVVDHEYWTEYVTEATHYEAWNEYIHETCSSTCCCDSEGNNCSTTYYDCSYVSHHSEKYTMQTNCGTVMSISEHYYNKLVRQFGNKLFKDLDRDYHTIDGDAYITTFKGEFSQLEYIVTEHNYVNRVQNSKDVHNYPNVDSTGDLYNYPPIKRNRQSAVLGAFTHLDTYVNKMNALIGRTHKVRVFYLFHMNKPRSIAFEQESLWKGGNQNEFVVNIGLDTQNNVLWCEPFSWTESFETKIKVRDFVEEKFDTVALDSENFVSLVNEVTEEVKRSYEWRNFELDFKYVRIYLSPMELVSLMMIVIVLTLVVSYFVISNEINP